jgi:hypothetical protein
MGGLPAVSRGQSLTVDASAGTSPYTPTGDGIYTSITVGDASAGVLNQPAFNLTSSGAVLVGNTSTGVGTYNLSGSATLTSSAVGGGLVVGQSGKGILNASDSSSVTLGSNGLYLGNTSTGASGTVNIGDSAAVQTGLAYIGNAGSGVVNQTGGTFNAAAGGSVYNVYLGYSATGQGTYDMVGGTGTGMHLYVGFMGTGTLNVSGGSYTGGATNSSLYVARMAGGQGTVNLTGGSLTEGQAVIGYAGPAVFNQTGGTFTVTTNQYLYTGYAAGGSATVALSGGVINANFGAILGYGSTSTVTQTGGTFNANLAFLAYQSTSTSLLTLAGSTAAFNASAMYIGYVGKGTVQVSAGTINANEIFDGYNGTAGINQSGGTINAGVGAPTVYIQAFGYQPGSTGTYTLSGGTFNVIDPVVGYAGTGVINQTGGVFYSSNYPVLLGNSDTGVGTYNLSGGTIATAGFARGTGSGTLNFNGGVVQPTATNGTIAGLTAANVLGGGAIFNPQVGAAVTVSQPLLNGTGGTTDGGLIKFGAGTVTLGGANTYTGPTQAVAGTLLVTNTTGSGTGTGDVFVSAGATLAGTGTIAGMVVVESGGNISGGATTTGIGTLHTGAQTWTGNASSGGYVVKTDGTTNDLLVMTGLTVSATSDAPFHVVALGSGVQLQKAASLLIATDSNTSDPSAVNPFAAALSANALVLDTSATTVLPATGDTLALRSTSDTGGYELYLVDVVATPEPASLLLLALTSAPLTVGRSRRRQGVRP